MPQQRVEQKHMEHSGTQKACVSIINYCNTCNRKRSFLHLFGTEIYVRALLDSVSQTAFVPTELERLMDLKSKFVNSVWVRETKRGYRRGAVSTLLGADARPKYFTKYASEQTSRKRLALSEILDPRLEQTVDRAVAAASIKPDLYRTLARSLTRASARGQPVRPSDGLR
ncbi:hypothetical protein EVAR_30849_1 [Eumeta japonica]|uniref:Uncharacterized protein n=1 Tax=Eumeta variegata TaxID=151549 RepID=A0A4C1XPN7_EUMVA|nr:hypothetical protein EVAR_30849_1 [Eumeta japonica]